MTIFTVMAKFILVCKGCSCKFEVNYKLRKQKYCTRDCVNKSFKGSGNPAYGKTYRTKETHPEWAQKVSSTSKERGINKGSKNGMKNPEVAKRQGQTRSQKFSSDPAWKEIASRVMREAWESGKYDHVPVGRCKWYNHTRPDGELVKLQGTWEVVFARHMDSLNLDYHAHKGRLTYIDLNGAERSYYPDFYIPMWDTYIDVKGAFFTDLQKQKFNFIKSSNPDINICLIGKEKFREMGIDVLKESKEILKFSQGSPN